MGKLGALKESLSILRGNFLVLLVTWIIFRLAFRIVGPYESLYICALGATPATLGFMSSLQTAVLCLSLIPGSYLADRWGRRSLIVVMTYVLGFSYLFYAVAPTWHLVLVGMLLAGLARLYSPALQAMTADSLPPEKRGMGYAMMRVVPDAFAVGSPVIAVLLIKSYGFVDGLRLAYLAVFASFMAAATIRLLFLKETLRPGETGERPGLIRLYADSVRDMANVLGQAPRPIKALILASVVALPLSQIIWGGPFGSGFVPLYVVDFSGVTEEGWGLLSSIRLAVGLLAGLVMGELVDRLSRKALLIARFLVGAPLTVLFVFARGFAQVLAVLLLVDLLSFMGMAALQALLADLTPRELRGRVIGARMLLLNLAAIPISSLVGYVYEAVDPKLPFFSSGVLSLAAALIIAALVEEPVKREL